MISKLANFLNKIIRTVLCHLSLSFYNHTICKLLLQVLWFKLTSVTSDSYHMINLSILNTKLESLKGFSTHTIDAILNK